VSIDIEQELAKVRARRAASPAGTGPALDIEAELAKVRARRAASVRAQYAAGDIPGFTTPERGPIRETPITQALRGYTRGYLMPISGRVKELQPVPERVKPVTMPQVRAQYAAGDIPGFTRPQRGPVEAIGGQRVAPVETIAEFAGASVGLPQRIVTGIAARIAPAAAASALGRLANNMEVGALYGVLDATVSHFEELRGMPPKEAAKRIAMAAGLTAAQFATFGVAIESLLAVMRLVGPTAFSAVRAARDYLRPTTAEAPAAIGATRPTPAKIPPIESPDLAIRTTEPVLPEPKPISEVKAAPITPEQRAAAESGMPAVRAGGPFVQPAVSTRPKVGQQVVWQADGQPYTVESVGPRGAVLVDPTGQVRINVMDKDIRPALVETPAQTRELTLEGQAAQATPADVGQQEALITTRAATPAFGEQPAARGPKPTPPEEMTLGQFVRNQGGISIGESPGVTGELRGVMRNAAGKPTGYVKAKVGISADRMGQLATEAGFRTATGEPISEGNITSILADELRGKLLYSTKGTGLQFEKRAAAQEQKMWKYVSGETGAMKISEPVGKAIEAAQQEINDIYSGTHRALAPARAPGMAEIPFVGQRNRLLGERDVYTLRSQVFWDRKVAPILARMPRAKGEDPATLRNAISLYLDRLHDPTGFDAHSATAAMKSPEFAAALERMNRMTHEEKTYAEQVINLWDHNRGKYRIDQEVMGQMLDFHVSHLWETTAAGRDIPPLRGQRGAAQLSPRSPFSLHRSIPTIAEGIDLGLTPRTMDIVTLNKLNDADTARAVMAKGMRDALLDSGMAKWSFEAIPGWEDLGAQLRIFRHPIQMKTPLVEGGKPPIIEQHLWVDPHAADALRFLWEQDPFKSPVGPGAFTNRLFKYNAWVKGMELNYSFFHDFNLAKVFFFSRPLASLKMTVSGPGLYQKWGPVAYGMKAITEMEPTLERLVQGGLKVGRDNVFDAYYAMTGGPQRWGLSNTVARARSRALWDVLHPSLKAADAMVTVKDALQKFSGMTNPKTHAPWTEEQIFEQVAEVMNRKYGGLNWHRYGTTRGMQTLMRALLLAPDWTLSNLMLGVSALKGGLHITSPETMFSNTVEGWAARQSLAKTVATFFVALQGVNILLNGHTTFQNDENRWLSLQLPWRSPDGRRIYADWLQPGELKDLIRAGEALGQGDIVQAMGFIKGKLAPITKTGVSLLTGTDYWGRQLKEPGMTNLEAAERYGSEAFKNIAPIPIGLTAFGEYLTGSRDLTQGIAGAIGAGPTPRGALVPSTIWQTLPTTNKREFMDRLSPAERDDLINQIATGRVTGTVGMKLDAYVKRVHYLQQQYRRERPPEERYAPRGARPPAPVVTVPP